MNKMYPGNIELLATKHIEKYTESGCKEILIERARALKNNIKDGEWKFSIPRAHPLTFVKYEANQMINISCIIEGKEKEIKKHNMELQVCSYCEKKKIFEFHIDLKNPEAKIPEPINHLHVLGYDVPRFPFPPMDIILLCEFVLINFFPEESEKLRKDPAWKKMVLDSQKLFVEPYFEKCQKCLYNEKETLMGHLINLRWGTNLTLSVKNAPLKSENQTLVDYTEYLTDWYISKVSESDRKQKGQYFTPGKISEFMIKQFQNLGKYENIKILDPGAGLGIFESAFCDFFKLLNKSISISFDVYENDMTVLPFLKHNMEICKREVEGSRVKVSYKIIPEDFLLSNSHVCLNQEDIFENEEKKYDFVVSNPPYYKINTNSSQVKHMKHIMNGQPNIYPFFMALSAKLLKPEGQISLLTPRSYCSGLYFKKFRNWFFEVVKPCKIHLFESRKELFGKYKVRQENIILNAVKTKRTPKNVQISVSTGIPLTDKDIQVRNTNYSNIIRKNRNDIILRIPTSEVDEIIASHIDKYKDNFGSLGFKVATGKVVPFRAKKLLNNSIGSNESVPLIWMQNISESEVLWPIDIANKFTKIKMTEESKKILVPNENYIFLKRFSTKEGKRRINAAVYFKKDLHAKLIGIENHVNYISKEYGELTKDEAYGIVTLLNSIIYNKYFQIESGTTQVNVKEISNIPLPSIDLIKKLGNSVIELNTNVNKIETTTKEKMVLNILNFDDEVLKDLTY